MDGSLFQLSEFEGEYLLVFPTVVGCGDCVFGINVISYVNEDHPLDNLDILIMDLYVDDDPSVWQYFAAEIDQANISWGVVDSETFLVDYEIDSLGPLLLIGPEGRIVFRSKHPISYFQLDALFGLIEGDA